MQKGSRINKTKVITMTLLLFYNCFPVLIKYMLFLHIQFQIVYLIKSTWNLF